MNAITFAGKKTAHNETILNVDYPSGCNDNLSSRLANNSACGQNSENNSTTEETSDLDLSENNGKPPVIYAWMKKVHINNTGNFMRVYGFFSEA